MKKATLQADGSWKIEDLTSEEVTAYNNTVAEGKAFKEAQEAAATKKATDKAAGTAKLKELGLTDDQIAALLN
tara:strand:- start:213 stop:431 length:219 start_codon:yes stop_codon:yes gene_type:complete